MDAEATINDGDFAGAGGAGADLKARQKAMAMYQRML